MPRRARQPSESGYLHLIVRGIGQQALFEDREDYAFFLNMLDRYRRETSVVVVAYCLMENHAHMLVRDDAGAVPLMMKKLGVSYSYYYNKKYGRCGHLFQDRYLSEVVDSEAYLLTVFRYILNNPTKAGLGPARDYEWSSYRLYGRADGLTDTTVPQALLGDANRYAEFVAAPNDDQCLEYEPPRHNDDWARKALQSCLGLPSGTALQALDRSARDDALLRLLNVGLSVRQIERLTGIGKGIIQRVKR